MRCREHNDSVNGRNTGELAVICASGMNAYIYLSHPNYKNHRMILSLESLW